MSNDAFHGVFSAKDLVSVIQAIDLTVFKVVSQVGTIYPQELDVRHSVNQAPCPKRNSKQTLNINPIVLMSDFLLAIPETAPFHPTST